MKPRSNYQSVKNACAMLHALSGAVPAGMTNKDLAQAVGIAPAQVTRLAAALIEIGWLRKLDDGNYCVTPVVGGMAVRVMTSFDAAQRQLADLQRNYTNPEL